LPEFAALSVRSSLECNTFQAIRLRKPGRLNR
jgi:hypothetical protein